MWVYFGSPWLSWHQGVVLMRVALIVLSFSSQPFVGVPDVFSTSQLSDAMPIDPSPVIDLPPLRSVSLWSTRDARR